MFTIPSSTSSPTALTLPTASLSVTAADVVSTRINTDAAPAPLSDQAVSDNAQSNTTLVQSAAQNVSTVTVSTQGVSGALASNLSASGPSSSFLAQLFSQADDQTGDAVSSTHFAPAPTYNALVGYGLIKYKPSNAGVPLQPSPLGDPVVAPDAGSNAAVVTPPANNNTAVTSAVTFTSSDVQAYSQTQSRNQTNLSFAAPQFVTAG